MSWGHGMVVGREKCQEGPSCKDTSLGCMGHCQRGLGTPGDGGVPSCDSACPELPTTPDHGGQEAQHGTRGDGWQCRGTPQHCSLPVPQAPAKPEMLSGSLTTHVLNTATGLPAAGLALRLAKLGEPRGQWMELAHR